MNALLPLESLYDVERGHELPLPPLLSRLYGCLQFPPHPDRPSVIGNFVSTLDGVVSLGGPGGSGGGEISGFNAHDRLVMGLLRAIADVVIVGAGTLRADPEHRWTAAYVAPSFAGEFQVLRTALGKSQSPLNVIVTAPRAVNLALPVFQSGEVPVLIVTTTHGEKRLVADTLRPVYEQTNRQDGYVSLEVSPDLAHNTEGTLAEVRRFWNTVDRPNLLVKIPATPAGIPAIRQALSEGININITLIFALANYRQVVEAYFGALEKRSAKGQDIGHIASVASFFVSRVDVLVDSLLEERITAAGERVERQKLQALQGKIAIANARLVYQEFKRLFSGPRFAALRQRDAHVQRPLWASTSTKNPAYRDVLYAEELIGPDTVDTMPLTTIEHFRDHGRVRLSIEDNVQEAKAELAALEEVGIHYDQVTRQLQEEGVQKFADSFHTLYAGIDHKRKVLQQ